jgi:hypothetical protein
MVQCRSAHITIRPAGLCPCCRAPYSSVDSELPVRIKRTYQSEDASVCRSRIVLRELNLTRANSRVPDRHHFALQTNCWQPGPVLLPARAGAPRQDQIPSPIKRVLEPSRARPGSLLDRDWRDRRTREIGSEKGSKPLANARGSVRRLRVLSSLQSRDRQGAVRQSLFQLS